MVRIDAHLKREHVEDGGPEIGDLLQPDTAQPSAAKNDRAGDVDENPCFSICAATLPATPAKPTVKAPCDGMSIR